MVAGGRGAGSKPSVMHRRALSSGVVAVLAALLIGGQGAASLSSGALRARARVAAVQVALRAVGRYRGPVDGIAGSLTLGAVRSFQGAHGLPVNGEAGPSTLKLLGPLGRPEPESRLLRRGMVGLDVAALQFELHRHRYRVVENGFFDAATRRALILFQRSAGLPVDAIAGPATYAALDRLDARVQAGPAVRLRPPLGVKARPAVRLRAPLGVKARPVASKAGVELFCPYATAVAAATAAIVTYAGDRGSGYGYTVITRDRRGVQLLYGHLARIDVHRGQRVVAGAMVGLAGWTGKTSAITSLRLELSINGRPLDTMHALGLRTGPP